MIRIVLPFHLRNLARTGTEVQVAVPAPITLGAALTALEAQYPVLRGTIREYGTNKRRSLVRFFACKEDLSNEPPDMQLPEDVINGKEPLMIIGAIAGG
ncbi:MAG: MoaD/ThiS family protein [Limisphaerales bacterium]